MSTRNLTSKFKMADLVKSIVLFLFIISVSASDDAKDVKDSLRLKIFTVASDITDGCRRFLRSGKVFGLDIEVIGVGGDGLGEDERYRFGDYKTNTLIESLKPHKDDENLLVLFTDNCEDSLFTAGKEEIIEKFLKLNANVVLPAKDTPIPFKTEKYPALDGDGYKYVYGKAIIGYAPWLHKSLLTSTEDYKNDHEFHITFMYILYDYDYNIKLDRRAELFQNLNKTFVEPYFEGALVRVTNNRLKTFPALIVQDEENKIHMNQLANYMPSVWNFEKGCIECDEDMVNLSEAKDWPTVYIGLFVTTLTPFLDSFLLHISNLRYPKNKLFVFIFNNQDYHTVEINSWIEKFENEYKGVRHVGPPEFLSEQEARNLVVLQAKKSKSDFYFSVDSVATLYNTDTLKLLIEQNRTLLAPALTRPKTYFSNWWGDVNAEGYYARSADYFEIVENKRWGVWNVPCVNTAYLIKSETLQRIGAHPFHGEDKEADVAFCQNNRQQGIFMFVSNAETWGHLKKMSAFNTKHVHNDLYEVDQNRWDWEDKYLHPQFYQYLRPVQKPVMPCKDVYWVPVFKTNFTRALIDECENFGNWSSGGHKDERISGGYENVPTVDIHMNQIGFENGWLYILKEYFSPMATRVFAGYYSNSKSYMNFVVKYNPSGQYFLRPHHDESTYTVNLALNQVGVDYEGGGARFIRYNCSVASTEEGWALLHPGRLTHYHEGLETTKGTRYIMISFVDP